VLYSITSLIHFYQQVIGQVGIVHLLNWLISNRFGHVKVWYHEARMFPGHCPLLGVAITFAAFQRLVLSLSSGKNSEGWGIPTLLALFNWPDWVAVPSPCLSHGDGYRGSLWNTVDIIWTLFRQQFMRHMTKSHWK
jgi:hypothetical protein